MISRLLELTQIGPIRAGIINIPEKHWPQPGQYLPCQRSSDKPDILVTNLFPVLGDDGVLTLTPIPGDWYPGDRIQYLPPQGRGFELPSTVRRIGLLPFGVSPLRLLTVVNDTLTQNASLTLFLDSEQRDAYLDFIPSWVEIVPQSALEENFDWLDFLAVDIEREALDELFERIGQPGLAFEGQVLIRSGMPCRGLGTCGVCGVKTTKGWRLVCKDGPEFDLAEVLNVA